MNANNHFANRNQTQVFSSLGLVTLISMGNIQDGCSVIKVYRHDWMYRTFYFSKGCGR